MAVKAARKPKADPDTPVRAAVTLARSGWTPRDIAAGLGVSLSTVYSRLKLADAIAARHADRRAS